MTIWPFLYCALVHVIPAQKPMTIGISNIREAKGAVLVAVFQKEQGFLEHDKAVFKQKYPVASSGNMSVVIPELPEGAYAVSCFHDLNGNNILDKNIFGVPSEPYGFSNNARPKFRAPSWQEARFWFGGGEVWVKVEGW
jgi:uncharacterized protein (DUF2141 family)